MKLKYLILLGLTLLATTGRAQDDQPAAYGEGWYLQTTPETDIQPAPTVFPELPNPTFPGGTNAVAEVITPDISSLARNLQNSPTQIYNYVHDHIRYVHYFGSHKGAEMTLLERSGNDFDQCALLVALLRAAGYSPTYQFGMGIFSNATPNQIDYQHWVGTAMPPTNWPASAQLIANINFNYGFPYTSTFLSGSTLISNIVSFHHVWVQVSVSGTNFQLDPSFKSSVAANGIALNAAAQINTNTLLTDAGGTTTAASVQGLNEGALRSDLTAYTGNLLNYIQSNVPNASVQQIIGGQTIAPSAGLPLGQPLAFLPYTSGGSWPISTWSYIPTNLMSVFLIGLPGTNIALYTPAISGNRLSLVSTSNGMAQLWQEDTNIVSVQTTGTSSNFTMTWGIQHPYGTNWNFSLPGFYPSRWAGDDQSITNAFLRTNAFYNLAYAFDVNAAWLTERQRQLDTYRAQGWPDTSRQVVTESLNVMGLTWLLETELADQILAFQTTNLHHYQHRFGRLGQEPGNGYYIDVSGEGLTLIATGTTNASGAALANQAFGVGAYFSSAMEHAVIQQLNSSNLTAASTVKVIELASTNAQTIYLATSSNWSTGANISQSITGYNTNALYSSYISQGSGLLLPESGSVPINGTNSWAGSGYVSFQLVNGGIGSISMIIGGGYDGGFVSNPQSTISQSTPDIATTSANSLQYFNTQLPTFSLPPQYVAEPVNIADGTFEVTSSDLTLGQLDPKGLNLSRYYSSSRRNSNLAGMAPGWLNSYYANAFLGSAPQDGLGATTPEQMAPMLVALRVALDMFNGSQADPKGWTITALIAKWGLDQLINTVVSVNLGNDTIQFVQQPNGSFTPPANCTMTLTANGSGYNLQARRGSTFMFAGSGLLTNITDPYGEAMNLTYNSSNWVQTVTDWKSRQLTFTYSGTPPTLASVSDGTRTVSYGYTANPNGQLDLTSFTDPDHNACSYTYDTNHQIITALDQLNRLVVSNLYDNYGQVLTQYTRGLTNEPWQIYVSGFNSIEVDPSGDQSIFTYDNQSRQTAMEDALGHIAQTFYDGQDHVIQTISPKGETNSFLYDGNNNLIETIDPLGFSNTFVFDGQNNLIASTDGRGDTNHFGYNAEFSLTGQTNGNGDWKTFIYNTDGTLATSQDAGGTTDYGYDSWGQLNAVTYPGGLGGESFVNNSFGDRTSHTDANDNLTTFGYNYRRQLTNATAPTNLTTLMGYDPIGNATTTTDARTFITSNTWSVTRHLLATTLPTTPQGVPIITNTYDLRDWLMETQNPLNKATYYTNDAAHRLIASADPLQRATDYSYDNDGNRTNTTDAALEKTTGYFDARGSVIKIIDAATNIAGKAYDGAGNLIALTNRNTNVWHFQYDGANRLTSTTSPLGHGMTNGFNNRGLLAATTNGLGQSTIFGYDARARMTTKTDNVGVNNYQYDANNNLTLVTNVGGPALSWTYDAYNRATSFTDTTGNVIQYRYDNNGNLTNLIYPGASRVVKYYYDSLNRVTNVTDWANRQTIFAYDLGGRLTSITRPNDTVRLMGYDDDGELTNIVERTTGQFPICFYTLNYSNNGRIQWEFKGPLPHAYTPPTRTTAYDADNRLSTFNGTNVTLDWNGNLTYGPGTNNTFNAYGYDARNELTNAGGITYAYDPQGARVSTSEGITNTAFVTDPETSQTLMRIKTSGFTNTVVEEQLINSTGSYSTIYTVGPYPQGFGYGSTFALSGFTGSLSTLNGNWLCLETGFFDENEYYAAFEYDYGSSDSFDFESQQGVFSFPPSASTVNTYYVFAPGIGLLYESDETPTTTNMAYYHFDSRGSTVALTDQNGNITDQVEYSPYGTTTYRAGTTDTPFLYNGQFGVQTDPSGLLYMRARYYNPYICRFLNPDPSGFTAGLNFYAFGDGNPISEEDPFGLNTQINNVEDLRVNINPNVFPEQLAYQAPGSPQYQPGAPYYDPSSPSTYSTQVGPTPTPLPDILGLNDPEQRARLNFLLLDASLLLPGLAEEEMVTVTHFTDAQTVANIQSGTGTLNAGSFVTLPSEVAGMNVGQVETALEIDAGKGAYSSTFQTPAANLGPAFNGPLTSGGKIQFQLINPTPPGPFVPTPP